MFKYERPKIDSIIFVLIFIDASNWMRFVRRAEKWSEQNLYVMQQGDGIYYTSSKIITSKAELRVGYSLAYASKRGLAVLSPDETDLQGKWKPKFKVHFVISDT